MSKGLSAFVFRKIAKYLPDKPYLVWRYKLAFGKRPDLKNPKTFNEVVQWTKLYDRNPLYHTLVDKVDVKEYVAGIIGEEHIVPTLGVWDSPSQIDWDTLPEKFVLKCTHDSGSTIVCTDKQSFDKSSACSKLAKALSKDFYLHEREWAYKGLKPRIIAEEYLCDDPSDYKFFCFGGKPEYMFIATDRAAAEETKFDFFDMDFKHLDMRNGHPNAAVAPSKPQTFGQMKTLAEQLAKGIPQVRVDFYEVGGKVYFGEYTFCHWGGFVPFEPESADALMGSAFRLP